MKNICKDTKKAAEVVEKKEKAEEHIREALLALDFDLKDPNLIDTPRRIAAWWASASFVGECPEITTFPCNPEESELVILRDITLRTLCPHHFAPYFGKIHVGYIPHKKIVGLSKVVRLVQWCTKRPIIQEELTTKIASEILKRLEVKGVMVIIVAKHTCMSCRGVNENAETITSAIRGIFRTPPKGKDPRAEMLELLKSNI